MAITASGFLATDTGKLKMYQYTISPTYMYSNKKFDAGISYTRFIQGLKAGFNVRSFKNNFYASAMYKKT